MENHTLKGTKILEENKSSTLLSILIFVKLPLQRHSVIDLLMSFYFLPFNVIIVTQG
jgi:hypothetical protein